MINVLEYRLYSHIMKHNAIEGHFNKNLTKFLHIRKWNFFSVLIRIPIKRKEFSIFP